MNLCYQTYDILTLHHRQEKILQVGPVESDGFLVVESDVESEFGGSIVEIALNKRTYLAIFKQAHDYWHDCRSQFKSIETQSTDKLWDLYKVTVSYLLTTNDHHYIVGIHENILTELYNRGEPILDTELEIISTLISSKMRKVNKNSLLWHLMKKLTTINGTVDEITIYRIFKSCQYHPCNYYASEFLIWLVRVRRLLGQDNELIEQLLVKSCRSDLLDVSLWITLKQYLQINNEVVISDYNVMVDDVNSKFKSHISHLVAKQHLEDHSHLISTQLNWLFTIKCQNETPYILLVDYTKELMIQQISKETQQLDKLDKSGVLYSDQIDYIRILTKVSRR